MYFRGCTKLITKIVKQKISTKKFYDNVFGCKKLNFMHFMTA